MNALSQTSHRPSIAAQALAPAARLWQRAQDGIARALGLQNAGHASKVVTIAGVTLLAVSTILGPVGPAVYGAGLWTTGVGAGGIAENHITKKVANWDGKGKSSNS